MRKSSAWPLSWIYVVLIIYASLYPFTDWRTQGLDPWFFIFRPLPRYWSWFDVLTNIAGYMPIGFLWVLGCLRGGSGKHFVLYVVILVALLSGFMEALQTYLPSRRPSNLDWILNSLGGFMGAFVALVLERRGLINRWTQFKSDWFIKESRGGIVLLALWPLCLLFPAPVPFGLGQILERLQQSLSSWINVPALTKWSMPGQMNMQPLEPGFEILCVSLGLFIPCALGFCIIKQRPKRMIFLVFVFLSGTLFTALSSAMSFGPEHGWVWLTWPTKAAMLLAFFTMSALVVCPSKICAALVLVALGVYLSLLNQAPLNPYFAQALSLWEEGRFIRFHGLIQWMGWIWPYAVMLYVFEIIWSLDLKN